MHQRCERCGITRPHRLRYIRDRRAAKPRGKGLEAAVTRGGRWRWQSFTSSRARTTCNDGGIVESCLIICVQSRLVVRASVKKSCGRCKPATPNKPGDACMLIDRRHGSCMVDRLARRSPFSVRSRRRPNMSDSRSKLKLGHVSKSLLITTLSSMDLFGSCRELLEVHFVAT